MEFGNELGQGNIQQAGAEEGELLVLNPGELSNAPGEFCPVPR